MRSPISALGLFGMLAMGACDMEPGPAIDGTCDGAGGRQVLLARSITFARQEAGVAAGFDLDGAVSTAGAASGCGVADLIDPEGVPGIDNALSGILPILDTTEAVALEPLIQDSINNGALLMMAELSDVDDPIDDACVDVSIFKGLGEPMIGADGWILPNQTLQADESSLGNEAHANPMVAGRLDAGPIPVVALPIQVLDLDTTMEIFDARIRVEQQADGTWAGYLAGGLKLVDLLGIAALQNLDPAILAVIEPALAALADLGPDEQGVCQQISVVLRFEMVPAFLYEEGS